MISRIVKVAAAAALAMSFVTVAHAQNCRNLPPGPFRWQCAVKKHPHLAVIREKCMEEARATGLLPGEGHQSRAGEGIGGMAFYVRACIHRTVSAHRAHLD